jgi:hypothetical protein
MEDKILEKAFKHIDKTGSGSLSKLLESTVKEARADERLKLFEIAKDSADAMHISDDETAEFMQNYLTILAGKLKIKLKEVD